MEWFFLLASILFASLLWTSISIILNYSTARKTGFPIVISPVSPLNPLWISTSRTFPVVLKLKYLPFGFGTWARCTYMGWSFDDKHALHDELGPILTIVTPGGNEVTVADPEAAQTILTRRKDFIKPAVMYDQLNVFGRNLNTVEGKDWERQRRLTAPSFNEKTSSLVWSEAIRQSEDMAASWLGQAAKGTTEVASDTATLALHVLTCVGFGLSYPFHAGVRKLPAGHSMTYRDALSLCLRNIITFALFPKKYLSLSFLPEKLRLLGQATREFQRYMEEMLAHERDVTQKSEGRVSNLMGALVRASDEAEQSTEESTPSSHGLTDDEIFGNIFAFNLAGHETTANTVAAAIVLLAANPEYQTWLAEELQYVFGHNTDPKDFPYEEAFPKLQRCMAVMYETLRLYGSIVFIPKTTNLHPQTLSLHNKEYLLPPNTAVNINVQALHTSPKTWAPDPSTWRPKRWLQQPTAGSPIGTEHFIDPDPGTYIPWAAGPRVCVGRKFSQVEFVAVMATLFQHNRVRPALQPGQSEEEGRRALMDMVEESAITFITLQMREPGRVPLVWEKRP